MKKTKKQIETEARSYYYAAKNPAKARTSKKMDALKKAWESLGGGENGETWGDVIA